METLKGYKTYIVGALGLAVTGMWLAGVIDTATANQCIVALGFGGMITLRAGMKS